VERSACVSDFGSLANTAAGRRAWKLPTEESIGGLEVQELAHWVVFLDKVMTS